jgi:K+-transporting ATPase ATPase C chain
MNTFIAHIRISLIATMIFVVVLCAAYPLLVWGAAQVIFPDKANGSLITRNGTVVGSALIGQPFSDPKYFHPRPSAAGNGYDPTASGGTNLGPTSDKLINGQHKKTDDGKDDPTNLDGVKDLVPAYRQENGLDERTKIPVDAVTRSASGLDPDISLENAKLQAPRVAKARNLSEQDVLAAVRSCTEGPTLGLLGEPRVNVLRLNLALDQRP